MESRQISVTLRIFNTLRDAAKEEALRGMSFSAFVRTCMIEELAKKGGISMQPTYFDSKASVVKNGLVQIVEAGG